ncbi:DGQHR domain-containing protein DpdB [Archangium gephyra]|nr:DGQHR domain-containing protein DpdB [Archangium gephyra]
MPNELILPAVEVKQAPGRKLYCFAVDGKLVHRFAAISRVSRKEDGGLHGYQRPEVLSHIEGIRDYIESSSPMVPNAIVLAFDSRVRFKAASGVTTTPYSRPGVLIIPLGRDEQSDEQKPGFVVDGQQRIAAIRDATIRSFPICVTAFITNDVRQQTEQFLLVNSTKPLPKGLIYELLPRTDAQLPVQLHRRRLPALLLEQLNLDPNSPLKGMIHTATNPVGRIKDNSILKMLENSLNDGALHKFRKLGSKEADIESMLELLRNYWTAISRVFHPEWGLSTKQSRLMHGAGIVSMGFIMDTISEHIQSTRIPTDLQYEAELQSLRPMCRWTTGEWDFGNGQKRKWNELQNTSQDIDLLSKYLIAQYRSRVMHQEKTPHRTSRR